MSERPSLGRIIATPILLMVAGYLIGGLYGVGIAAIVGIVYIAVASSRR